MAGPIGTKFGTRLQILLEMEIFRLNTIRPSIPQVAFRGVLRGHKFKSGKAAKRLDRLAPNLVHVCGFIWEWTRLKIIRPTIPHGGIILGFLGGQQFKRLGNVVKRLDRLRINCAHIMLMNLGMDTC